MAEVLRTLAWFDGLKRRDFENGAVLDEIRTVFKEYDPLRSEVAQELVQLKKKQAALNERLRKLLKGRQEAFAEYLEKPESESSAKNGKLNGKLYVHEIFAFLATDEDGDEGVAAKIVPGVGALPFIAADRSRLTSLHPIVAEMIRATNSKVKLCRFSMREDLEEIS